MDVINNMPTLIMLIGIPASGKSYIANRFAEEYADRPNGVVIHSSDELRKELFDDVNEQCQNDTLFQELHKRVKTDLKDGKTVIYDATNIHRRNRIAFLNELKSAKIKCYKTCCLVVSTYEDCLKRNSERERSIPESVIERMYKHFEPPMIQEGWDQITVIYNISESNTVKLYNIENFFKNAILIDQENEHHTKTIGVHCLDVYHYIRDRYPDDLILQLAGLLHDCGKPFTKSFIKSDGTKDTQCHYYNHPNVGAYDSFFYLLDMNLTFGEVIKIANLICEHMKPMDWQNDKTKKKYKKKFGNVMYQRLIKLNEADKAMAKGERNEYKKN